MQIRNGVASDMRSRHQDYIATINNWCLENTNNNNEKSAQRRCKHCALAVVRRSQKLHPAADPFPGVWDGQNLISWRWSLPSPTNPVW